MNFEHKNVKSLFFGLFMFQKILICFFLLFKSNVFFGDQTKFVVLILSYNNEKFVEQNIQSALDQSYENYRILYVNDCSTDRTLDVLQSYLENHPKKKYVTIIDNTERKKGVRNFFEVIHKHVDDQEIICCLDGDDRFYNKFALDFLSVIYENSQKEVWITFGSYIGSKTRSNAFSNFHDYPVIDNRFRRTNAIPSHLKTFYGWLFKKIRKEDLLYEGNFMENTSDLAIMLPMLEMAQNHYFFINKILYEYNESNPINVHKINRQGQKNIESYLRKQPPYESLD